jgi:glycosyltransferase involved in cell wall biosynthesis
MGAHVRMLAAGLSARGVEVSLFAPAGTGTDLALTSLPGAEFTPVDFGDRPRPQDAKAVLALRQLLAAPDTRPDVVHAHGMRAGALTAIALIGIGTSDKRDTSGNQAATRKPRLVVTVHNAPPTGGGAARLVYLALERLVARRANLVLAVSFDLEQRMRAAGARETARAIVPAPRGTASETRPDPRPGADDRPLVLAVGRLAPQKGFATLIDAAAAWQHLIPRPRLVIAGDGPLRDELTRKAAAGGTDAEFPGHLPGIPDLLARASVFVMPSWWEGQPLALQEALKAGVPIVASDVGGIPDLTGDDAAVLVEPGDAERLGRAVLSVLDDDALAARLRAAARERAKTLPTEDEAVAAVLAAYDRILM